MERRRFTREFKLEAVRLIKDRGVSYVQASQDLKVHPTQLRRVNVQVLRCAHIRYAAILDQAYSLKLELSCKLPSLHDPPPAPSKHLTWCLRNQVQAIWTPRELHLLSVWAPHQN